MQQQQMVRTSVYFGLMSEFGTTEVPLVDVASKYLNLDERSAKERASAQELPFPVYRCGSRKSPWMVNIGALAQFLERQQELARNQWEAINGVIAKL